MARFGPIWATKGFAAQSVSPCWGMLHALRCSGQGTFRSRFLSKAAVAYSQKDVAPGTFPDATPYSRSPAASRALGLSAGLRAQSIHSLRDQPTAVGTHVAPTDPPGAGD